MAPIFERLRKVVVEQLEVEAEAVTPEASFVDDLEADSLDLVELITAVEEEFSVPGKRVEITDEDAEKMGTVQDAIDCLRALGVEGE